MISGDQMGMVGGYGTGHDEKNRDFFWQKHLPARDFCGSTFRPTSLDPNNGPA